MFFGLIDCQVQRQLFFNFSNENKNRLLARNYHSSTRLKQTWSIICYVSFQKKNYVLRVVLYACIIMMSNLTQLQIKLGRAPLPFGRCWLKPAGTKQMSRLQFLSAACPQPFSAGKYLFLLIFKQSLRFKLNHLNYNHFFQ